MGPQIHPEDPAAQPFTLEIPFLPGLEDDSGSEQPGRDDEDAQTQLIHTPVHISWQHSHEWRRVLPSLAVGVCALLAIAATVSGWLLIQANERAVEAELGKHSAQQALKKSEAARAEADAWDLEAELATNQTQEAMRGAMVALGAQALKGRTNIGDVDRLVLQMMLTQLPSSALVAVNATLLEAATDVLSEPFYYSGMVS